MWLIVVKEVTNTMIFKVFEYGAGYVADYSADSDEIVSHWQNAFNFCNFNGHLNFNKTNIQWQYFFL